MPISRAQFNEGLEDMSYKIVAFLKAHSQEAFEIEEIADSVYAAATKTGAPTLAEKMARAKLLEFPMAELVKKRQVEKKIIGDRAFYCIVLD